MSVNRGQIERGLTRFLAEKGDFLLEFAPTMVPTIQVNDLVDSPYYQGFSEPVAAYNGIGAVVGEFGHIFAQPGVNVVLQIDQYHIVNTNAAIITVFAAIASAATFAAVANNVTNLRFQSLTSQDFSDRTRSSTSKSGTNAAVLLTQFHQYTIPANTTLIVTPPKPICLFGDDLNGVPSLGFAHIVANQQLAINYFGRQWPLPDK